MRHRMYVCVCGYKCVCVVLDHATLTMNILNS